MISLDYLDLLRQIYTRLQPEQINWALTSSLSFALQGVPVIPHDIDLQTDASGAYAIERIFAEDMVKPVAFSATETIRSHFGRFKIGAITIEIMGDIQKRNPDGTWEDPVNLEQHRRSIEIEGMAIPVLALEYEYQAYLKLGRYERAQLLWSNIQARRDGGE